MVRPPTTWLTSPVKCPGPPQCDSKPCALVGADSPVVITWHAVPLHRVVAVEQPSQSAAGVPLHLIVLALGTGRQERDARGYRTASPVDLIRVHFSQLSLRANSPYDCAKRYIFENITSPGSTLLLAFGPTSYARQRAGLMSPVMKCTLRDRRSSLETLAAFRAAASLAAAAHSFRAPMQRAWRG